MEEGLLVPSGNPGKEKVNDGRPLGAAGRLAICRECPLYVADLQVCNQGLWMDPRNGKTARHAMKGYVRGCGCRVTSKAAHPEKHCVAGLW